MSRGPSKRFQEIHLEPAYRYVTEVYKKNITKKEKEKIFNKLFENLPPLNFENMQKYENVYVNLKEGSTIKSSGNSVKSEYLIYILMKMKESDDIEGINNAKKSLIKYYSNKNKRNESKVIGVLKDCFSEMSLDYSDNNSEKSENKMTKENSEDKTTKENKWIQINEKMVMVRCYRGLCGYNTSGTKKKKSILTLPVDISDFFECTLKESRYISVIYNGKKLSVPERISQHTKDNSNPKNHEIEFHKGTDLVKSLLSIPETEMDNHYVIFIKYNDDSFGISIIKNNDVYNIDKIRKNGFPLNTIYYGPPGTGKTYKSMLYAVAVCYGLNMEFVEKISFPLVKKLYDELLDSSRIKFITFHQSYGYEEFIEGIKPKVDYRSGNIKYDVVPGVFKKFCENAMINPNLDYMLIIDEINRGNVSKIFGEIITLIEDEKRDTKNEKLSITLPYSQKPFLVPNNLYILGTMNTADRSLSRIDTALRRRFNFIEMQPEESLFNDVWIGDKENGIYIQKILKTINTRIKFVLDREHTIGHAYFVPLLNQKDRNINTLLEIFRNKIIPLLQEYFYDDYEKILFVLNDKSDNFIKTYNWEGKNDTYISNIIYEINWNFLNGLDENGNILADSKIIDGFKNIYNENK